MNDLSEKRIEMLQERVAGMVDTEMMLNHKLQKEEVVYALLQYVVTMKNDKDFWSFAEEALLEVTNKVAEAWGHCEIA